MFEPWIILVYPTAVLSDFFCSIMATIFLLSRYQTVQGFMPHTLLNSNIFTLN